MTSWNALPIWVEPYITPKKKFEKNVVGSQVLPIIIFTFEHLSSK